MLSIYTNVEYIYDLFAYSLKFKVLIYISYKYALNKDTLLSYIKNKYSKYSTKEESTNINSILSNFTILLSNEVKVSTFNTYFFKDLELYSNSYSYNKYIYATSNYKEIRKHSNKSYNTSILDSNTIELFTSNLKL